MNMLNLRNNLLLLYDFYIVAKEKNISKAASKNLVSQSNLSRSIQNLEEQLQLKLVNTSNKGITLTLDGQKLFKKLDMMFTNFDTPNNNDITGEITIGTTRNIADHFLIKYLIKLNKSFPSIKIKLLTDNPVTLNELITNHKIDLLIDYLPHINFSEKYDFEVKVIGHFKTCFACSHEFYEKEGKKIKTLKDLSSYNLALPGNSRRRQLLDETLQLNNVHLEPIIEMPDSKIMCELVLYSDFVGYFIEEKAIASNLKILKLTDKLPTNIIGLIYSKNTVNDITRKFIDVILEKEN